MIIYQIRFSPMFYLVYSKCERPHGLLAFFIVINPSYLCAAKHKDLEL